MLEAFLRHRREIVTRRTIFDLAKARERAHILEGLAVALANIDEVIALIKASPSPAEARAALHGARLDVRRRAAAAGARGRHFHAAARASARSSASATAAATSCPRAQAQAILDMRLHRLTGLEQDKIIAEYQELLAQHRRSQRHPRAPRAARRR